MYKFKNDYSEGAHRKLLEALLKHNLNQQNGYGEDIYTEEAKSNIKNYINGQCDIHFIPGGTQTNLIAITAFLRPHEACIAAKTGHIVDHETGAIEATGHKVININTPVDGKLTPELIQPVLEYHYFEHMVKPKLVYISNSTEIGTVYSKNELKNLYNFCQTNKLYLYIDGARIGNAILASDVTLQDMYNYSDAFFIGGTKNGALLGEALIIKNLDIKNEIRYIIKQRGALIAKGRIMGIQFNELFKDNLYFELAKHANNMADILTIELKKLGCSFLVESSTNQIFPIIDNKKINKLLKKFDFYIWEKFDENSSVIRLVTSWATPIKAVNAFINEYKNI
ncbi:L-threonine aldolase [Hypnocyclicus thermotrophus]|uniref:L-threonine aldolase n=1 Tax=Hypnocyclicus thermotrophus TaxID=1627895 RepID=A0AA46I5A4_9FUSO|nr:aminotransferase class I/II-fold pyridoxal phosphate-dependent enzyme [Hypnocyclicus thermotrophus]TDT69227.1 L-threonine aldolase [Hypnocyclicus thermotrophus]